jgi:predicted nucleic acid-binding protein
VRDAVADTSVFVAGEAGRPPGNAPDGDVLVSVVTLAELRVGVLRARDAPTRAAREATLGLARRFIPLAVDERVADRLAEMVAALREAERRVNLFDAIIAATADVHGLAVWTCDDDFAVLAAVAGGPQVLRA